MTIESEIKRAIALGCDIEIKYEKYNGETSQRILSNISYDNSYGTYGYNNDHIKGLCHLRNEERTFRISRIITVRVLPSGPLVSSHAPIVNKIQIPEVSYSIPPALHNNGHSHTDTPNNTLKKTYNAESSSNGGCYIATMAYGSYDHPQVIVLRWYRDHVLQKNYVGRLFIHAYYYISPKIVVALKGHKTINRLIRIILDKYVQRIREQRIEKK